MTHDEMIEVIQAPKEIWVNEYDVAGPVVHPTEAEAKQCALPHAARTAVLYREVV